VQARKVVDWNFAAVKGAVLGCGFSHVVQPEHCGCNKDHDHQFDCIQGAMLGLGFTGSSIICATELIQILTAPLIFCEASRNSSER
jgi:hypothetical protein